VQRSASMGYNRIAQKYALIPANRDVSNAAIAAVCDTVKERVRTLGDSYALPLFTDAHEMMRTAPVYFEAEIGGFAVNERTFRNFGARLPGDRKAWTRYRANPLHVSGLAPVACPEHLVNGIEQTTDGPTALHGASPRHPATARHARYA